jgi:8-oxo-dGTP pyrophosphatase MutT (NUDIX family)
VLEAHGGMMPEMYDDPPRRALHAALAAHPAADAAEARDVGRVMALLEASERAFDRSHFTPGHITGSAFVVDARSGRVLLHHHRRLDRWLQVGGHDDGERDALATALREGREESGLADLALLRDGILDVDVHVIPAGRGEPEHEHHDVRYAVTTHTPESLEMDVAESRALAWLTLDEAARRMDEPGAARALAKLASLVG